MSENHSSLPKKRGHGGALQKGGLHLVAGFISGMAIFAGILCLFAMILCKVDIPIRFLSPLTTIATCIAVLAGGMVFSRLQKKHGLFLGALLGIGTFLLIWVISAIQGSSGLTQMAAIKAVAMGCSGAIGGYIGVLRSEKKHRLH